MNNSRSIYNFPISCDRNLLNSLIQNYLSSNGFQLVSKNGENFYKGGDSVVGYRGFNYSFNGQTLDISVWIIDVFGKDFSLDSNSLNVSIMAYRNSLNQLFQEISNLNTGMTNNMKNPAQAQQAYFNNSFSNQNQVQNSGLNNSQNFNNMQYQNYHQNNASQVVHNFQNETRKKQEIMCEVGFWLSILGLFASFFGICVGLIIYFFTFYFAIQGLKTRKRGKAIATIVISIISILIGLFIIMLAIISNYLK